MAFAVNSTLPASTCGTSAAVTDDSVLKQVLTSWTTWTTLLIGWMVLCSIFRFKREKAMLRKFNYPNRASFGRMTNDDAQAILQNIIQWEFPAFYQLSLQFAIFKTYGLPTVSSLLASTKAFTDPNSAPKRYEDTVCIFGQFSVNPPTHPQAIKAIARMNFLHSQYRKSGHILNADLLYTLSVCITEPIRFMQLYEWRPLNAVEKCAIATFWKSIGDAMQIEYKGHLSQTDWKDGLEFYEDIRAWAKDYEVKCMVPATSNQKLSEQLVAMLIFHVPDFMKPFVTQVIVVLMGDRMAAAYKYPESGITAALFAYTALYIRYFIVRFLCLPRMTPRMVFSDPDPKTGRIQHTDYLVHPWYFRGNFWSRWGPVALVTRILGGWVPGKEGDKFLPEGFLFSDLGPANRMGKGEEFVDAEEERLRQQRPTGCPFSMT